MGKGKGSRSTLRAFIREGSFFFKISRIRPVGLRQFLLKISTRCYFSVGIEQPQSPYYLAGLPTYWLQTKQIQTGYLLKKLEEFKDAFKKHHRPLFLGYVTRIFWWRFLIPYAV